MVLDIRSFKYLYASILTHGKNSKPGSSQFLEDTDEIKEDRLKKVGFKATSMEEADSDLKKVSRKIVDESYDNLKA